jgi:hypothetical protein
MASYSRTLPTHVTGKSIQWEAAIKIIKTIKIRKQKIRQKPDFLMMWHKGRKSTLISVSKWNVNP